MGTVREPAVAMDSKLLEISESEGFESRRLIEAIIIAALKQENTRVIGICGFDEIGDTRLAREISEKVKAENLFNVVVMGSFEATSNELLSKLIMKEKILIVLYDVPDILDIGKFEILLEMHKGPCKMMITSRFKGVFMAMGALQIFAAQGVEKELWILCSDNIGNTFGAPDLYPLARSITQEFRGLPFAPTLVDRISRDKNKVWLETLAGKTPNPKFSYMSEPQQKMVVQGLVHSCPELRNQAIACSSSANPQNHMNEESFCSTSRQSTVTEENERRKEEIGHEAEPEVSILAKKIMNPDLSYISEPQKQMVVQGLVHSCPELCNQATQGKTIANSQSNMNEKSFCSTSRQKRCVTEENQRKEIGHETKLEVSIDMLLCDIRYLTDCMLFCSVFPTEYVFTKDMLVWQWIALGLIESEEHKIMEEAYIQCFDALLNSGYIMALRCDLYAQMKYQFGDKMVVFLQKQLIEPKFQKHLDNEQTDVAKVEHLSLSFKDIDSIDFGVLKQCSHLQSLTIYHCCGSKVRLPRDLFSELKALKILNIIHTSIDLFPESFEVLKELRYLYISNTPIWTLPDSICCFSSLWSLILDRCMVYRLPESLNKLINLRYLDVNDSQLKSMPIGIGKLLKLRTLRTFVVGVGDGRRIGELKDLNELKGSFHIMCLENVTTKEEAAMARLSDKQNLIKIELQWSYVLKDEKNTDQEEILESLQPPLGIQELIIFCYGGRVLPSWISNPLFSELVSVTLHRCRHCDGLPSLGELPSLKVLNIFLNDDITEINSFFCRKQTNQHHVAFPKLEELSFNQMFKLEKWTGLENGDFPRLSRLVMVLCPKFVLLPFLSHLSSLSRMVIYDCPELPCLPEGGLPPTLKSLRIRDCPELKWPCFNKGCEDCWSKVAHVPDIKIDGIKVSL